MTTSRLITFLTALPDYAVRALPEIERHQLAKQCLRLLKAAELRESSKGGILARLDNGERSQ